MLDEFRSTNITWDKATSRIYSPVTANASDENGRKLVVQIVNSGQVEDLTGATLHLYWETRDKAHDGLDVFKAVDLEKGEFELSYTTGMLSNHGVLNANLVLIDTVGRVVSERFKITVTEGIDNDAIQSENSFSSLTQALIDISNLEQNYAPRLNDLTAQLQQTEQELSAQLADINSGKVDKNGSGQVPWANIAQDAREQIIGTTPPAVVGVDSVLEVNITDNAVTPRKISHLKASRNLTNPSELQVGKVLSDSIKGVNSNTEYNTTGNIPVVEGQTYYINSFRRIQRLTSVETGRALVDVIEGSNTGGVVNIPIGSGIAFIMYSYQASELFTQMEEGTSFTTHVPFEAYEHDDTMTKITTPDVFSDGVIMPIAPSRNLVNTIRSTVGYIEAAGHVTSNAAYETTEPIPIVNGETYTISPRFRKFLRLDTSENPVEESFIDENTNYYTFTASADGYVRFAYHVTEKASVMMEKSDKFTAFVPFGVTETEKTKTADYLVYSDKRIVKNPLFQAEADGFGDSIMAGDGNGGIGIRDKIAYKFNMSGTDYSAGGSTFGYVSGRGHIPTQIQNAVSSGMAPNVIFVNGGTNDILYCPLGTISSGYDYVANGYADFSSGMEYAFGLLKANFPTVPIIYIRAHHMVSRDATLQKTYGERALEICEKWSVKPVDLYKNSGLNTNISTMLAYTDTPGTHPNDQGYDLFYLPQIIAAAQEVMTS